VLIPVLMTARLVQEHLQHTQINLFVFFLCLLAFERFRARRTWTGGLALATAASTKAVPILLLGYLVFRRRWAAAAWTVGFLIALNVVLPVAVFGPARALEHWRSWRAVAAAEVRDPAPGFANQSLLAALKRLVTVEGGTRDPVRYPVAAWSPHAVQLVFAGVAGLLALGLAWAFGWRPPPEDSRRAAAEVAICLAAMTIVSPLAWKAHYVTLLASYVVAWEWLRSGARPRGAWVGWWGSFACLTLSAPALVGGPVRGALESLNVITAGAVLVVGLALAGLHHALEPVPGNRRDA
jgi:glycosyl transferase family 87